MKNFWLERRTYLKFKGMFQEPTVKAGNFYSFATIEKAFMDMGKKACMGVHKPK